MKQLNQSAAWECIGHAFLRKAAGEVEVNDHARDGYCAAVIKS